MAERLTDRGIAALKPSDTDHYDFDSEVTGLAVGLSVRPQGFRVRLAREQHAAPRHHRAVSGMDHRQGAYPRQPLRLKADTGETVVPGAAAASST